MSPLGWVALAGAVATVLLPASAVARVSDLASEGRLTAGARLAAGARLPRARTGRGGRLKRAQLRWGGVIAAALPVAVAVWGGPALGLAAAGVVVVVALSVRDLVLSRRGRRRHRALLTAVRLLAAELSAGARPAAALGAAASLDTDTLDLLGPAAEAESAGSAADVLAASADPAVRGLGAAWRLAATEGAALAEVVERVASDLAARDVARRAVAVAVAGPKSSAALLAGLPLIGIALGAAMGARPLQFLLTDSTGRVVCCVGVLLDAAGVLWLRRLVHGVQP